MTYRPKPGFKGLDAFGITVSRRLGRDHDGHRDRARHARRHRSGRAPRRRPAQGARRHGARHDRLRRPHRGRLHRRRDPPPRRPARPGHRPHARCAWLPAGARRRRAAARRRAAPRSTPAHWRKAMLIVIARDKNGNGGTLGRSVVLHGLLEEGQWSYPPHPGYGARMRRLLIALVLAARRRARDGVGRARARHPGRRLPELRRAERLAARRASCGPDVIRYNVDWSSVARARPGAAARPGRPGLRLGGDGPDRARPRRQGARVLLTIVQAPRWANGGGAPRTAPLDAGDYGTFCRAVATRYSGSFVPGGRDRAAAARDELHGLERAQPRPVPAAAGRARLGGAAR